MSDQAKTVQDIIRETATLVQEKTASFKKQAIAGGDASDYPGAECDKPVAASAGAANPEVKQELPPNGTSATGAQDAEQLESGHSKDSTQPADATVTKKPMQTDDANAKCASDANADLANSLLSRIRAHQEKTAAAQEPEAGEEQEETSEEKEAENCDKDEKKPAEKKAAEPKAAEPKSDEEPEKKAEGEDVVELTTDVLAKIASVVLSTEEGIEFAEGQLTKAAGAEAAKETMDFLHKQAAYEQGQADAEAMIYELAMQKQAEEQMGYTEDDLVKAGQALADEILAAEGGGGDLGTGEEGAEVVEDIADGGDEGGFTPEELQAALAMMVESGELDPAVAEQILASLGGDMGGEEAPVEEAPVEEAPAEEEMEVAASAEDLESKILAAVKKVQETKK